MTIIEKNKCFTDTILRWQSVSTLNPHPRYLLCWCYMEMTSSEISYVGDVYFQKKTSDSI